MCVDYLLFLDIHCSDWTNEPRTVLGLLVTVVFSSHIQHFITFGQRETFEIMYSEFLVYNRKETWHKNPPFIFANCTENHTQFLLLAYDSTSGRLRCKNLHWKFFALSALIGGYSARKSLFCHLGLAGSGLPL